jgi:hypothetical protein
LDFWENVGYDQSAPHVPRKAQRKRRKRIKKPYEGTDSIEHGLPGVAIENEFLRSYRRLQTSITSVH